MRPVARDRAPVGVRRLRRLRLLPQPFALVRGFRLYPICAADGMPIGWELAAANIGERVVAAEMLDRVPVAGHVVIADKNFAGAEFEELMARRGATFLRPDRKNEPRRHGSLGAVRQWIESPSGPAKANSASNATAPAP